MTAAIETSNLTKIFKNYKAVDSLNLNVPEGSIYGFLGPNGAGKTTTIKMLTGLSNPSEGSIKIYGREVRFGSYKNRLDIGFLPDVPNFYDWMTPVEFLTFTGELFCIDKKILRNRIDSLMELVGLCGIKKKVGSFSRGMKQRLGIAQALINQPKIVFMDEPTSALDPIGRKEVMDILLKLSGKVTVFFSSHILSDIERVCDRVVILNKGKMMLEDSIEELRHRYSKRIIIIETDHDEKKLKLIEAIEKQEWAEKVQNMENGELRIHVSSMTKAQHDISGIISYNGAALKKFTVLEPTLEDIFMKVVETK
jgi:ABC-2 type transport system ATP-binding protein